VFVSYVFTKYVAKIEIEVKKLVISGSETALKVLETAESQFNQIIDQQKGQINNEPRRLRRTMGTTRDYEFQREYEEAVREYDLTHPSLPPGLVLPSGETIQERIDSGKVGSDVASFLKRARSSNYDNLVIVSKKMCDKINSSL